MNHKLRKNIQACHEKLEADLTAGDPKAKALVASMRGELNAARVSLGLKPLNVSKMGKGPTGQNEENS